MSEGCIHCKHERQAYRHIKDGNGNDLYIQCAMPLPYDDGEVRMSWTDPARVEKMEALLYRCHATFDAMLEHADSLLDREHVQRAYDALTEKMSALDLPDYDTWKRLAGNGHQDWTCQDLEGIDEDGCRVFHCSKCGCVLSLATKDGKNTLCTSFIYGYPRHCPDCGRKVTG